MNITIAQRRHNNLSKSDPKDVVPLGHDHRALTEMRTLFPSTVLDVKEGRRILISGHNNRKIGKQVAKGIWKGMPIFTLTLEERATCPSTCFMLKSCYGNAMPFARRNRHGEEFIAALHDEISGYAVQYPEGFVVRLHVLGDFYSVDYVTCWDFWLTEFPQLHVYGYTSRTQDSDIGRAIIGLNNEFPDRSYIRWSGLTSLPMGATVIARVPESSMVPEGLVCPAETSDAECCATCTLCWSPAMRNKTIVFIQHGKGATMTKANITLVSQKSEDGLRQIRSFNTGLQQWDALAGEIIEIKQVDPTELWVDDRYQRNLSRKGTQLITKICKSWDWRKFKPPVVTTEADGRLHVIDGQHTAIAAASHPQIKKIPVMLVDATTLAERAKTFIGINRDRVAVTPAQIFYAEFAGNDPEALAVKAMCDAADVIILRSPQQAGDYGPGETSAIATLRRMYRNIGTQRGKRVLNILVESGITPVSEWSMIAVSKLVTDKKYTPRLADEKIWQTIRSMGEHLLAKAYARRADTGDSLPVSTANIIWEAR